MSASKARQLFCQLCGQPLVGQGKLFHHPDWLQGKALRVCETCEHNKPRCRVCGLPMGAPTPNGVCTICSASQRICLVCGKLIHEKYLEFDGVGPYCMACYQERARCDVCSAPLTDEHWRLSDGRVMCAYCHRTAIYSAADATTLYEEMKIIVVQELGLTLNIPTGLALVDRNQLAEVIRQQEEAARASGQVEPGAASNQELNPQLTLGLYARRGMRRGIYVQTGLPRLLFLQVAAHEYTHAWQGENCPTLVMLRGAIVHEGLAEWVAYRIMEHYGYQRGQERMLDRQDVYGQGLRWALELEARHGIDGVLRVCRADLAEYHRAEE